MDQKTIQAITCFIFMEEQPAPADVILIPGSARSATCERAAALYRAGYAPLVLPSGRYSPKVGRFAYENADPRYGTNFETEFEYCCHILMENGVPDAAILREDRATNTVENACYSAAVLRRAGVTVRRAILSTQAFHARRAYMSYAPYFPGVELLVVPSATRGIDRDNWHTTPEGWALVLEEVGKCGKYFADPTLRLTSPEE